MTAYREWTPSRKLAQEGVVLVIALMLLTILTLLAVTGMTMATAELRMASNEQLHRQVIDAASAGVEAVIARLGHETARDYRVPLTVVGRASEADYLATATYAGEEPNLAGFSTGRFAGRHFEIESVAQAARNATDAQVQGVMVIIGADGADTFEQTAQGLQP